MAVQLESNAKALSASNNAAQKLFAGLPLNKYTKTIGTGIPYHEIAELAVMSTALAFKAAGVFKEVTTIFANNGVPIMQNNSNHGIDLMAQYANGDWISFEVKAGSTSSYPQLEGDQNLGANAFTRSRLSRAANAGKWWRDPLGTRQSTAASMLTQQNAKPFEGYVISFNNFGKQNMGIKMDSWR